MFLGIFRKKVKTVKIKRKKQTKKTTKNGTKRLKSKKPKKKVIRTVKKVGKTRVRRTKKRISKPKVPVLQEVGKITHYFPHVKAGVILVTNGKISLGDTIHIKGHTTDFKQKVNSIQINNIPLKQGKPGQEIGILVKSRVRHNDVVYKI